jgi:lipopolysaccharide export system protein LptA
LLATISFCSFALESDKNQEFSMTADNFKNLPALNNGLTKIKYWGNVAIQQGSLKIKAHDAIIFNGKTGISEVDLSGSPVVMEQLIDDDFGKLDVKANHIVYSIKDDMLYMTGEVSIKSKVQGEMTGEKISMNLKTNEISGVKSENKRVKLIIKPQSKNP